MKGFSPSLNSKLMQWTHARQSLLRVEAERPGLAAVRSKCMPLDEQTQSVVPPRWRWWAPPDGGVRRPLRYHGGINRL